MNLKKRGYVVVVLKLFVSTTAFTLYRFCVLFGTASNFKIARKNKIMNLVDDSFILTLTVV